MGIWVWHDMDHCAFHNGEAPSLREALIPRNRGKDRALGEEADTCVFRFLCSVENECVRLTSCRKCEGLQVPGLDSARLISRQAKASGFFSVAAGTLDYGRPQGQAQRKDRSTRAWEAYSAPLMSAYLKLCELGSRDRVTTSSADMDAELWQDLESAAPLFKAFLQATAWCRGQSIMVSWIPGLFHGLSDYSVR